MALDRAQVRLLKFLFLRANKHPYTKSSSLSSSCSDPSSQFSCVLELLYIQVLLYDGPVQTFSEAKRLPFKAPAAHGGILKLKLLKFLWILLRAIWDLSIFAGSSSNHPATKPFFYNRASLKLKLSLLQSFQHLLKDSWCVARWASKCQQILRCSRWNFRKILIIDTPWATGA